MNSVIVTSVIYLICCLYISIISLRKYVSYPHNFEHTLYWGMAFMLLSVRNVLRILTFNNQSYMYGLNGAGNMIENISWWLQLYAIIYVTIWCNKDKTSACTFCRVCKRKAIRICTWSLCSLTIIIGQLLQGSFILTQCKNVNCSDVFYLALHVIMAFYAAHLLFRFRRQGAYLYVAFIMYGIGNIVYVINAFIKNAVLSPNVALGITTSAIIVFTFEIFKIIDKD